MLDVGDADQAEEQVRHRVAGGEQARELVVEADGTDQDSREVVRRDVYSGQLLHGLRAGTEEEAADRLGAAFVAGLAAQEVPPFDGVGLLVLDGVDDFFVLRQDEGVVDVAVLEVGEDLESFVFVLVGDEPSDMFVSCTSHGEMVMRSPTLETPAATARSSRE